MARMLQLMISPADNSAMLSPTLQFDVTPQQQQLLAAYQAQAASLKVTSEEFDGWLERVDQLSGVDVDQLTALHGQLIASGMLKFEISGRSVGLKYQLSQQGKKALEVDAVVDEEPSQLADSFDSDVVQEQLAQNESEQALKITAESAVDAEPITQTEESSQQHVSEAA